MNVRTVKKTQKRVDTSYVSRYKMQAYGIDNLYPQNMRMITNASGTAELCLSRYAKFIEGYGYLSQALADMPASSDGAKMDDILHYVAQDIARYGGFALHVNYNVLCQITEVNFVPFENCRLEEADDAGNVAHILVHPDWSGKLTRAGHTVYVNERNIVRFNVFNPEADVVSREIMAAGGIDRYKGQIMWCSMAGKYVYPTPVYDAALSEISTDEGLGNIKYRNARNNFLVPCMIVAKKGLPSIAGDKEEHPIQQDSRVISDDDLRDFQGDTNTGKIMYIELENDEDEPKILPFPTKSFDKDFSVTDASVIERIYAQFHQELFYAIRIGKLGFSGQVMKDAYEYYCGEVTNEQRFIERAFAQVMANWYDEAYRGADITLQPLKYISADVNTNNTIENE